MKISHPSWCPCLTCQQWEREQTARIVATLDRMRQQFAVRDVQSLVQERLKQEAIRESL